MVDRNTRDRLAELLRQLCSGAIDVDEYENAAASLAAISNDTGVRKIFEASEFLYDVENGPLLSMRLFGKRRLPRMVRRNIARSIAFLHSDLKYEWPDDLRPPNTHGFAYLMLSALIASAGLLSVVFKPLITILCFAATAFLFVFHQYHAWRILRRWNMRLRDTTGLDSDFWPFRDAAEFDTVNRQPRLLAGRP